MRGRIGMIAAALIVAPVMAHAQSAPTRIASADPDRALILDALRVEIARDLGQPVKFIVNDMRTYRGWAFAMVAPRTPAGAEIDFSKTHYAEQQEQGVLDGDTIYALLRQEGGTWRVVTFVIGPTDVAWEGWSDEFGAPKALFAR
ncbi:hypothetical protein P1X14_16950 [Sphingomonas sp. AOB5]|uniref:hypothetical protein n=1 Tax=Sphingomonas sp. AOB5 TaxID=3034017 RepID=UPI0023F63A05|nr:hypothetical protein [Sphingomonas sp. AOB5]MDF7776948.1 hypothetical protein [Sphingomonas sp. AOB5]